MNFNVTIQANNGSPKILEYCIINDNDNFDEENCRRSIVGFFMSQNIQVLKIEKSENYE